MAKPMKLTDDEIARQLAGHPAWTIREGKLHRALRFRDFVEAFGFMTRVALVAERSDHHPDWKNVWNRVEIDLVTHDADGLTERDFALASAIDALAA